MPAPDVLSDAQAQLAPYPHARSRHAIGAAACARLSEVFDAQTAWTRHDTSFYHCFIAEITAAVDPALVGALRERVSALLDVPLTDQAMVTAQRMEAGDHALPHTDRPLLGYEAARVVLHLNADWTPEAGGLCEVRASPVGPPTHTLPPALDHAFVFLASPRSHHAVLPASRPRRSVVFHFWHAGNGEAAVAEIEALFEGFRVDALPRALDPAVLAAEARFSDDDTLRAAAVAWVCTRWGLPEPAIEAAYLATLPDGAAPSTAALAAAWRLAAWAVDLRHERFDADTWAALAPKLGDLPADAPALARTARALFPAAR